MNKIELNKITQAYYYGATGIQELSLVLENNSRLAVLADEQGGKTSLIKAIAGLAPISGGQILLNDVDITFAKPKKRDLMMILGREGLFQNKTVRYNLSYSLKIRKYPKEEIREVIEQIAQRLDITRILDVKAGRLSGDDVVRVTVGRVLTRGAAVFLFDDIFAEADNRRKVFLELYPIIKDLNGIVIFATSSVDEAMTVGEELLLLSYGFCVQKGSAEAVFRNPQSISAYNFFYGITSNTVDAILREEDGVVFTELMGIKIIIDSERLLSKIYVGSMVKACFSTRLSEQGVFVKEKFIEYYNGRQILHSQWGEFDIVTAIEKDNFDGEWRIAINKKSLRLFDENNEKIIYYA